jgi:hypothetical protein
MDRIYQPEILKQVELIIEGLEYANFFKEYEIADLTYTRNYLADKLTDKFISGDLEGNIDDLFTEDEFDIILREIVTGTILNELKDKGYVDSYEDENTEEVFFLTEDGKKYMKKMDGLV